MSENTRQTDRSTFELTQSWIESAAIGGAILGGGGGGSLEEGIEFGQLAADYGGARIVPLAALDADDVVLTVSGVGAPAAEDRHVLPKDYVRAVELLVDELANRGRPVGALMTNEMGGFATVNGLLQSAVTGIPVVDAACNGRAHPTGPMGSIGLPNDGPYLQAAAGGDPDTDSHLELVIEASLDTAAGMIRSAAEAAGGLVAVARNPVTAEYAREHAAVEVFDQAVEIGRAVTDAPDDGDVPERVAAALDGRVAVSGQVKSVDIETTGGFDVGTAEIDDADLTFWNEYMTLDVDDQRVATFPDLITSIDADSGMPVSTADLQPGQSVSVVVAPASVLSLGAGMSDPALFEPVEEAIERDVLSYAFPEVA